MKVSEVIQRVESLISKGMSVSLEGGYISRRWIYNILSSYRSKLLVQKFNKKQRISSFSRQTISCLALEDVPVDECSCDGIELCTMKRTVAKIPELLLGLSEYAIESIIGNGNRIDLVRFNEAKYQKYSRFSKKKTTAWLKDGYLYFNNADYIDYVSVTALFNDPVEVERFNMEHNHCGDYDYQNRCFTNPLDIDFGLDDDMIDTCVMMAVQELSMAFLQQKQQQEQQKQEDND